MTSPLDVPGGGRAAGSSITPWQLAEAAQRQASATGRESILILDFPTPAGDPLAWLANAPGIRPAFYWRGRDGREYAALGAAHVIPVGGDRPIRQATDEAADFLRENVFSDIALESRRPRFFGGFAFDPSAPPDPLWEKGGLDAGRIVLPEATFIRQGSESHLLLAICATPAGGRDTLPNELKRLNALYWHGFAEALDRPAIPRAVCHEDMEREEHARWHRGVAAVLHAIAAGRIRKAVLSRRRIWQNRDAVPFDTWRIMRFLRRTQPDCFLFATCPNETAAFIGASPERLAAISGMTLQTEAVAGTVRRGRDDTEDQMLASHLLDSEKDRREHAVVVDYLTELLNPLCARLEASPSPEVRCLSTVQHLETRITGELKADASAGTILEALHPTPAVGGFPREAALVLIREIEGRSRGWYAAPVGWIGTDQAEFAVAIRSALLVKDSAWLFAGAGLVAGSDPEAEWRETECKLQALRAALDGDTTL